MEGIVGMQAVVGMVVFGRFLYAGEETGHLICGVLDTNQAASPLWDSAYLGS